MMIVGTIPTGAQLKIDEIIKDKQSIKIVWADTNEVHVVGAKYEHWNMTHKLYGYRFFTIGDTWMWSGDFEEVL